MSLFDRGYMRPSRSESPGNGMQTLWALIAINAVMFCWSLRPARGSMESSA